MKIGRLLLSGSIALGASGTIFAADPEKEMRRKAYDTEQQEHMKRLQDSFNLGILFNAIMDDTLDEKTLQQFILDTQLTPNTINPDGDTAMMVAAWSNKPHIIALLIKYGGDPNTKDFDGNTPLMVAAKHQYMGIVHELMKHGVNLNVQNNQGNTALMNAALYGKEEAFTTLMTQGADPTIQNNQGQTASDLAEQYKKEQSKEQQSETCLLQ